MNEVSISDLERSPLQSKKFHAYLLAEITWKILLGLMIYRWTDKRTTVMISVIIVAGFIEVGFILGQAALDKYVRVAAILKPKKNGEGQNGEGQNGDPTTPKPPTPDSETPPTTPTSSSTPTTPQTPSTPGPTP